MKSINSLSLIWSYYYKLFLKRLILAFILVPSPVIFIFIVTSKSRFLINILFIVYLLLNFVIIYRFLNLRKKNTVERDNFPYLVKSEIPAAPNYFSYFSKKIIKVIDIRNYFNRLGFKLFIQYPEKNFSTETLKAIQLYKVGILNIIENRVSVSHFIQPINFEQDIDVNLYSYKNLLKVFIYIDYLKQDNNFDKQKRKMVNEYFLSFMEFNEKISTYHLQYEYIHAKTTINQKLIFNYEKYGLSTELYEELKKIILEKLNEIKYQIEQ